MNLPIAYRTFLNKNCEYVVGKTISWFNNGYVHYVENLDEALLEKIKSDPKSDTNKSPVTTKVYPTTSDQKMTLGTIPHQGLDARYQHEWAPNCASGLWRKTVYDLVSVIIKTGPNGPYDYFLYIRLKLEWYGSGGWQQNAGEYRDININISGTANTPCGSPTSFNIVETLYTNSTVERSLSQGTWIVQNCNTYYNKEYSIYGSISSKVYMNGTCNGTLQTQSNYEVPGGGVPGYLWE
ncbi:hypothetical protein GCM10028807_36280 [Spirosoma daeguense]